MPRSSAANAAASAFTRQDKINILAVCVIVLGGLATIFGNLLSFWKDTEKQFATLNVRVESLEKAIAPQLHAAAQEHEGR